MEKQLDKRQIVYVAGPFWAPTRHQTAENIAHLQQEGLKLLKRGFVVIFPCWLGDFIPTTELMDPIKRELWKEMIVGSDCEIIRRCCDAIYLCRGWSFSSGAKREYKVALEFGKVIMFENRKDE